jgi:hypothetical protein
VSRKGTFRDRPPRKLEIRNPKFETSPKSEFKKRGGCDPSSVVATSAIVVIQGFGIISATAYETL